MTPPRSARSRCQSQGGEEHAPGVAEASGCRCQGGGNGTGVLGRAPVPKVPLPGWLALWGVQAVWLVTPYRHELPVILELDVRGSFSFPIRIRPFHMSHTPRARICCATLPCFIDPAVCHERPGGCGAARCFSCCSLRAEVEEGPFAPNPSPPGVGCCCGIWLLQGALAARRCVCVRASYRCT